MGFSLLWVVSGGRRGKIWCDGGRILINLLQHKKDSLFITRIGNPGLSITAEVTDNNQCIDKHRKQQLMKFIYVEHVILIHIRGNMI